MERNSNEKTCKDCTHFVQHYRKGENRLYKIGGHCMRNRNKRADKLCENFTLRNLEHEKLQREKSIVECLSDIEHRLDDIKEVLRTE